MEKMLHVAYTFSAENTIEKQRVSVCTVCVFERVKEGLSGSRFKKKMKKKVKKKARERNYDCQ